RPAVVSRWDIARPAWPAPTTSTSIDDGREGTGWKPGGCVVCSYMGTSVSMRARAGHPRNLGRVRRELAWLSDDRLPLREYALAAARILRRAVAFDGACVLTFDPGTLLPTGEIVENALPPEALRRMAEIEMAGDDVNTFAGLARAPQRAASLSAATGVKL